MKKTTKQLLFERMHSVGGMPLKESLLKEEYSNGNLYGYHVTPLENLDSISKDGLKIGRGAMQGEGLYAFYYKSNDELKDQYNSGHARYYATKSYDDTAIVKFIFQVPTKLLIFEPDIAKQIHGSKYLISDQIGKFYNGNQILEKSAEMNNMKIDDFNDLINKKFINREHNWQMGLLITQYQNLGDGRLFNGEYGLTFIITNPNSIEAIGYFKHDGKSHKISDFIEIESTVGSLYNQDGKYINLKSNGININSLQDIITTKNKLNNKLLSVRNNRQYDLVQNLIDELDKLENEVETNKSNNNFIDKRGIS